MSEGDTAIAAAGNVVSREDVTTAVAAGVEASSGLDVIFAIAGLIARQGYRQV